MSQEFEISALQCSLLFIGTPKTPSYPCMRVNSGTYACNLQIFLSLTLVKNFGFAGPELLFIVIQI